MSKNESSGEKRPKTDLDEKFIAVASQVMRAHSIKSDRALSVELGYRPDFVNRVRNGVQSAPAAAWDALTNKYPEAREITNISVTTKDGPAVGKVEGDANFSMSDCKRELEAARQQLADKDKLIASLEKTIESQERYIGLLSGGHNRPN